MNHTSMLHRPFARIDHVLTRLKRLWHYYPEDSLAELVLLITVYANRAESDSPSVCMEDIEDIAYPEGHLLHGNRHLEMGIELLEKLHENEPLPPVPIQTATLGKFADHWRRWPDCRLGQILFNNVRITEIEDDLMMTELEEEPLANGN